jgi:hypothetical protein
MKATHFLFGVLVGALSGALCFGQSTATLSGTVTDPSGAVVPHAHVVVHSLATGLDRAIDTDAAGLYVVPSLQPGDYSVQVTATGFGTTNLAHVTLAVGSTVAVNIPMKVSSAGETVQVESTAAAIESQTITVGQVIDRTTVQQLPLNGRHFLDLTVLTPGGVVAPTAGSLTAPSRGLGANSFITAGNREDSVNFQINGINLNDISQNQITFQPSISTTSEVKINNSTFSSEYGRSDGSIVTVATRSGSNRFHGEVFDYFRNEALDARNYFNRSYSPSTGLPLPLGSGRKAPLKRDNFGVSVGGPLWKDHTFFFASYEGLRQHQGILQNSPVFTQAVQQQIAANAAAEPAAAKLAALVPLPNSSGTNYVSFTPGPVQIDQGTMDLMQEFSANDSMHGFYAFQQDVRTEPALQGNTVPGWGDHRSAHRQIATLSETHVFNSSVVNEARFGFNRIAIAFQPANLTDPTSVGLADSLSGAVGIPQTLISDLSLNFGGPSGFPQGRFDTTGVASDTLTIIRGKHTIKTGGEGRRYLVANFTGNIGAITTTLANFEKDLVTTFSVQPNIIANRIYDNSIGGFVQDNYKVTPSVTLEGGLRFEWNGTPVEGANRLTIFNPATVTLTQVGTNGLSRTAAYGQNYNLEPRVGFSWDLSGKGSSVLRGGYGYMVDQPVSGVVSGMASNPPFSTAVTYSSNTAIPMSSLYASAKAAGIALAWVNPQFSNAYVESFNLNLQQELPWRMVGMVGYYGSVGRHLLIVTNANQPAGTATARPFSTLAANSPVAPGASIASNIAERNSIGHSSYNAMWSSLQKSFAGGLDFNMNFDWSKSLDINSLGSQGVLSLPDSNNPSLNYGPSDFDVRLHYAGSAVYRLPFKGHRLTEGFQLSSIMQFQTGNPVNITSGSETFNGLQGLARPTMVGNYTKSKQQLAATTNVTFIQNPGGTAFGGTVCDITNVTSACVFEVQGTQPSATAAAAPTVYTGLGTLSRNALYGPGYTDLDLSAEKDTRIAEGISFNLRADAFDILNHPNFGQPTGNVQSASFGQITGTRFATSDGGSSRQLQISAKVTF